MGRLTELFDYINKQDHPTARQIEENYHYINVNETLKGIRRAYRRELKNDTQQTLLFKE